MPRRRAPLLPTSSSSSSSSTPPPGSSSTHPWVPSVLVQAQVQVQHLNMTMAKLVNSARYDDCVVTCLGGVRVTEVRAPRSILALALPDFFSALHSRGEQPNLTILAPEFTAAEVGRAIEKYLSRGLDPHQIQQLEDEPGG